MIHDFANPSRQCARFTNLGVKHTWPEEYHNRESRITNHESRMEKLTPQRNLVAREAHNQAWSAGCCGVPSPPTPQLQLQLQVTCLAAVVVVEDHCSC